MTTKTYTCNEQFENETINVTANEELRLEFYAARRNQVEYNIVGDDIVLTVYGYQSYYDVDKSTVYGTVTIKNGAKKETFGEGSLVLYSRDGSENTSDNFYMGDKSTTENQTLKGTFHNEHFSDGFGNDTIETGSGNNIVELGYGGNNTVDLQDGSTTINWMNGSRWSGNLYKDYLVTGVDVIKNADGGDTLVIGYDDTFNTHIEFGKSGNDLVAVYNAQYESGAGKLTVKDYFTAEEKIKMKNSYVTNTMTYDENNNAISLEYDDDYYKSRNKKFDIKNYVEGNTTVNGTADDDIIIANAKSTIKTGKGDDTIYTSSATDTIVVDGDGEKTVVVKASSGNDVIKITNPNAVVNIDLCDSVYNSQVVDQSGNDLVISYQAYYFDTEAKERKQKGASVTVKDYFKKGNAYCVNTRDGYWKEYTDVINSKGKTITGSLNKNNTIKGTIFSDTITGGNKNDKITTGRGDDTITTLKGKDTITINGDGTKTINISQGDGAKTISGIEKSAKTVINAYFDNIYQNRNGKDLVLHCINASTFNEDTITIKNYYSDKKGTVNTNVSTKLYLNSTSSVFNPETYRPYKSGSNIASDAHNTALVGTAKKDVITANHINSNIYAGKGNDTIKINYQDQQTVYLRKGDGNDTVILGENANNVNLVNIGANYTSHSKKGNDLLIHRSYMNSDNEITSMETTTVKDYYKDNPDRTGVIRLNNGSYFSNYSTYYSGSVTTDDDGKYHFVVGTKKADKIILAGNNDVYAGAGNDTITSNSGYANIYAGSGNDTITTSCTESGSCTIYGGAGNDTIIAKGKAYIEDGAGDDTITVSANVGYNTNFSIEDGAGNDTFNLKTCAFLELNSGKNTVVVDSVGQTMDQTNIFSGAGDDTIKFKGAGNTVVLRMDNYNVIDEGNDTVIFEKDPTHNVMIKVRDGETYTKKGNDLIITDTHQNAKGKTVSENVTVKDFFIKQAVQNNLYLNGASASDKIAEILSSGNSVNITGVANKKTKKTDFTGSKFNDIVKGTAKVDNIITGTGNDVITAGKGNDIITIDGTGTKTINIANGDGKDTVKFTTTGATANFVYNKNDAISWSQSGNNLILLRTYDSGSKVLTEQTVVEGYFAEGFNNTVKVNGTDFSAETFAQLVSGNASKVNKVEITTAQNYIGGSKNDDITINANAEVFAGAGADKITVKDGNATVHTGAGNDTVTVEGGSDIKFVHGSGDGNDTIVFTNTPDSVNLSVDMKITEAELDSALQSGRLGFVKSGNDLLFSVPNGKKAEIITVKDYFAQESKKPENFNANLLLNGQTFYPSTLNDLIAALGLKISGITDKNKVTTFIGTDDYANVMNARGINKAEMYGGYDKDSYVVDLNKNSQIYIQDKDVFENEDGDEVLNYYEAVEGYSDYTKSCDKLVMNAGRSDIRMFFNVSNAASSFYDYTNIIVTDTTADFDSMIFLDKKSFTLDNLKNILADNGKGKGYIQIDDFFARQKTVGDSEVLQTPTDFRGEGYIEKVYTGKSTYTGDYIFHDEWMRNIKYDVAQWFASDGISSKGYTSVIDVIEKGIANSDMTDAKAVLALYQNSDYTQIVM